MRALRRYGALRQIPHATGLLIIGALARLGMGMTPLALVLLVESATSEYLWAGLAVGAYSFGNMSAGPIAGRLSDRVGLKRILMVTAAAHPVGLAAIVATAQLGARPAVLAASGFCGATYPPSTAAIRSAWSRLTTPGSTHADLRNLSLAAETAVFEIVFVAGPLLNAVFLIAGTPTDALTASVFLTTIGTAVLARHPAISGSASNHERPTAGPFTIPAFRVMLTCAVTMGTAFGAVTVAITAYATQRSTGHLAALLLTAWNFGSAVGGLYYGTRNWRLPLQRQLTTAVLILGLSTTALIAASTTPAMVALLVVSGLCISPTIAIYTTVTSRITPPAVLVEAHNWLATLPIGANALGTAAAGAIVDRPAGVPWTFGVAGSVLLLVSLTTFAFSNDRA